MEGEQNKLELEKQRALTPGGVTLIDSTELAERNVTSLADMLRYVPGVWVADGSTGDSSFFSSRGSNLDATNYDGNGIKFLQDGLPITAADGNNHNRSVDPLATRFAIVARGANALTYGASTLGGAIDFITPTARDTESQVFVNGGSHGQMQGRITAGGVSGKFDGLVTLEAKTWDGYREVQHEQQREGFYANAGWQLSETTVTGGNYFHEGGVATDLMTIVDNSADSLEIFLVDRWLLSQNWKLVYGAQAVMASREVRNTNAGSGVLYNPNADYDSINPRVGVIYQFDESSELFANISRLYEPPTNYELEDDASPDSEELKAMQGEVFEVGTRGRSGLGNNNEWFWELAVYYAQLQDEILSVDDPDAPGTSLFVGPTFDFVDDRYADFENTYTVDGYTLLGLRAGYSVKNWEVYADARNLTDEEYVSVFSVRNAAGPGDAILQPGEPRSFYLGLTYRF